MIVNAKKKKNQKCLGEEGRRGDLVILDTRYQRNSNHTSIGTHHIALSLYSREETSKKSITFSQEEGKV